MWVAVRLPEGTVGGHANQARIRTWDWNDKSGVIFAADVVSFAVRKGLYPASARAPRVAVRMAAAGTAGVVVVVAGVAVAAAAAVPLKPAPLGWTMSLCSHAVCLSET